MKTNDLQVTGKCRAVPEQSRFNVQSDPKGNESRNLRGTFCNIRQGGSVRGLPLARLAAAVRHGVELFRGKGKT